MKFLPPPGPERRRQFTRLAIILAGLAGVLWYQWPPAAPAVPASNVPTAARTDASGLTLPEPVRLGDLEDAPAATAVGRNPFAFGASPAATPAVAFTPPPAAFAPGPVVPEGPPPIALRLTALMVGPGSDRPLATLKDPATGAIFHGFEGDVVDGRYRIVKVGNQSVVVSYVDGSGIRTLGLGN
jgi:hypothetical protein